MRIVYKLDRFLFCQAGLLTVDLSIPLDFYV